MADPKICGVFPEGKQQHRCMPQKGSPKGNNSIDVCLRKASRAVVSRAYKARAAGAEVGQFLAHSTITANFQELTAAGLEAWEACLTLNLVRPCVAWINFCNLCKADS